ncbi:MAG: hypothetical protein ACXVP2_07565 [Tumebacillaceae bacterium]
MSKTEVQGTILQSLSIGLGVFQSRLKKVLQEKGIEQIDPNAWYDFDFVIDLLNQNGPAVQTQVGKQISDNAVFPPEVNTFEISLLTLNQAYHMNHRNGKIGEYVVTKEDPKTIKVVCNTPYQAKFNLGLIRGLAGKFQHMAKIEEVGNSVGGEFLVRL